MKSITAISIFMAGAAIGSFVTWKYVKDKYAAIAQEEIDSVKETFSRLRAEKKEDTEKEAEPLKSEHSVLNEKPDLMEYAQKLKESGYTNYSRSEDDDDPEDDCPPAPVPNRVTSDSVEKPYVISPMEFGEFDDYSRISLYYYADNFVADENDELVEDVDDVIGFESLTHFGEYEDDTVHVRNDRLKVDYEVLKDLRKYMDVIKGKPYYEREYREDYE